MTISLHAKNPSLKNIDSEQFVNLKAKEAILKELSEFELQEDNDKSFKALQDFQRRWAEIGFVPLKEKDRINQEFRNLINQKFDRLNLDELEKNLHKFRNKLDNWKSTNQFEEKIGQERNKIMLKLRQLESDIVVWENNIGFCQTKNSDALIRISSIDRDGSVIWSCNKKLDMIEEML